MLLSSNNFNKIYKYPITEFIMTYRTSQQENAFDVVPCSLTGRCLPERVLTSYSLNTFLEDSRTRGIGYALLTAFELGFDEVNDLLDGRKHTFPKRKVIDVKVKH